MKKLMIWWGWFWYRRPGSTFLIWTLLFLVVVFSPPLFIPSLKTSTTIMTIMPILGTLAMLLLYGVAIMMSTVSKNWRVAVTKAEKMLSDPKYKNEVDLLAELTAPIRYLKIGKELANKQLAEVVKLIEERDRITTRLDFKNAEIEELQDESSDLQSELSRINDTLHT